MLKTWAALCGVMAVAGAGSALAAGIRGDYVEARTNDVFTGPCFSNAEVFITGHQAVLAWKVTEGSFQGVDLAGLSVAAALHGSSTFATDRPADTKSVIIVDKAATPRQREALVALAKALVGDRMANVVEVKASTISIVLEHGTVDAATKPEAEHKGHVMPKSPYALFVAPGLAEVSTRPLDEGDHKCGNEVVAFPPLSKGVEVQPAYTLGNSFQGKGLGTRWSDPNARSSLVGRFAL